MTLSSNRKSIVRAVSGEGWGVPGFLPFVETFWMKVSFGLKPFWRGSVIGWEIFFEKSVILIKASDFGFFVELFLFLLFFGRGKPVWARDQKSVFQSGPQKLGVPELKNRNPKTLKTDFGAEPRYPSCFNVPGLRPATLTEKRGQPHERHKVWFQRPQKKKVPAPSKKKKINEKPKVAFNQNDTFVKKILIQWHSSPKTVSSQMTLSSQRFLLQKGRKPGIHSETARKIDPPRMKVSFGLKPSLDEGALWMRNIWHESVTEWQNFGQKCVILVKSDFWFFVELFSFFSFFWGAGTRSGPRWKKKCFSVRAQNFGHQSNPKP